MNAKCCQCEKVKPIVKSFHDESRANRPRTYWNGGYRGKVTHWCAECWEAGSVRQMIDRRRSVAKMLKQLPPKLRKTVLADIKADGNYPVRP